MQSKRLTTNMIYQKTSHTKRRRKNRYLVWGEVTASKLIGEFEAFSAEEAEAIAWRSTRIFVSVCKDCEESIIAPRIDALIIEKVALPATMVEYSDT
jgi:formylmethanofuran dehydrogenase subunit E